MSELPSFPVDPDDSTIDNCRRRVEEHADILILVVGGRYGYTDPSSAKSVTNLEYLTARSKGIPVYAFVRREVLSAVALWKANPTADFSSIVADSRVFEFIEKVRTVDSVWTRDFETSQDVVSALRTHSSIL